MWLCNAGGRRRRRRRARPCVVRVGGRGRGHGPSGTVLEAVRPLQVVAVQEDEAGVAPQRLPGALQDPRAGPVRGAGHREAHDGHRVHRRDDPLRAGRVPREALRRPEPRHLHVPARRAARHRRHPHRRFGPLHQPLLQSQLRG